MRRTRNALAPREPTTPQAGFTVTEMLIVLVILGLIAAAITPGLIGRFDNAKQRSAQLQLDTVSSALDSYYLDVGSYPPIDRGLGALMTAPLDLPGWSGPYLKSARSLTDPWGRTLRYRLETDTLARVYTYGADGVEGGEGNNTDLFVPDITVDAP